MESSNKYHLTEKQRDTLEAFRTKLIKEERDYFKNKDQENFYTEPDQLTRFLIARDFNVGKAHIMWTNWIKWHQATLPNQIKQEKLNKNLVASNRFYLHSHDKENHPCLIVKARLHFQDEFTWEELFSYFLLKLEEAFKQSDKNGSYKIVVIYDRIGFTQANVDKNGFAYLKRIVSTLQDYYPERLHAIYFLNLTVYFRAVWRMIRPFLNKKTVQKIHLLSKVSELQKFFTKECLLTDHQGTCHSPFEQVAENGIEDEEKLSDSVLKEIETEKINHPPLEIDELYKLTDKQAEEVQNLYRKIIAEQKSAFSSDEESDFYLDTDQLTRFLIAREFHLNKAFDMWLNWFKWHKATQPNKITIDMLNKTLVESNRFYVHRHDRDHHPCLIVKARLHVQDEYKWEELFSYFLFSLENAFKQADKNGTRKIVVIYDRIGFTQKNTDSNSFTYLKRIISTLQDFYPERLHAVYFIKLSAYFRFIWKMVKPFLNKKTVRKIFLLPKVSDLIKYFEKNDLITDHGGTCHSPFEQVEGEEPEEEIDEEGLKEIENDKNHD